MVLSNYLILPFSLLFSPRKGLSLSPTKSFTTASGLPVSRYGLGGAARSTQPSSLPSLYFDQLKKRKKSFHGDGDEKEEGAAPFYFYYNPNRYPAFMSGVDEVCTANQRDDIFVASGGTDLSHDGLDQRLSDCLAYCGGKYLDAFFLEYIVPGELDTANDDGGDIKMKPGAELAAALKHTRQWVQNGLVRYIGISTHSHQVGKVLAHSPEVDLLMLRYSMSHKDAAELISLPAARENGKPVIAFTSTRWNSLQDGTDDDRWNSRQGGAPSSADCLSFVFGSISSPPIEAVLHSARDEDELFESMTGLRQLSEAEEVKWREYGEIFEVANDDGFDEYPEERSGGRE